MDNKFLLHLDSVTEMDGIIVVEGWVICDSPSLDFVIKNNKNKSIEVEVERLSRPDVSRAVMGDDSHVDCGIRLRFQYDQCTEYTLIVSDGKRTRRNHFSLDGFTLSWRYNGPRYIAHSIGRSPAALLCAAKEEGIVNYVNQVRGNFRREKYRYHTWLKKHLPSDEELERQRKRTFDYAPKISLIVPAYKTPILFLRQMLKSIMDQTYTNWELCIADGSYPDRSVADELKSYAAADERIRCLELTENKGISGNTNAALSMATGEWIALMDHDDILAPSALYEIVERMNQDENIDVIYTDEDKISMDLRTSFSPTLKPDLSQEMLNSCNYICHFFCAKKSLVDSVGEFDPKCDGSQDYDFILRCVEKAKNVSHLARVLYHWRCHPNSTAAAAENKLYCYEAGVRALTKHFERMNIPAQAYISAYLGHYCLFFTPTEKALISVIMTGKITAEKVNKTKQSILDANDSWQYEFLYGRKSASKAKGKYLFFIKAGSVINPFHIEAPDGRCVSEKMIGKKAFPDNLIGQLLQPGVGAAGGRVIDAAGDIFYAGIVRNAHHGADYSFRRESHDSTGYNNRTLEAQSTAAVSLCCMMIKKEVYEAAGGLNPQLSKAFDDVALCYELSQMGYHHVYDPTVVVTIDIIQNKQPMHIVHSKNAHMVADRYRTLLSEPDPDFNPNMVVHMGRWELRE